MNSVPFKINGVYTDFVDLVGIARLEGEDLCLEFRKEHALSKFLKPGAREVRIPLAEIDEAVFKGRFCLGFLRLRARRLTAFAQVPGNEGDLLKLRCRRENWEAARELASRLSMQTVKRELSDLISATDTPPQKLRAQATPAPPDANTSQPNRRQAQAGSE